MYDAGNSKYTYKGTDILKNKLNIQDEELLKEYETRIVAFKIATINSQKLPQGYTPERLRFIHKYLFEDIFDFAGEYRQENITKDNFRFSEYEYIEENIERIFKSINIPEMKKMPFQKFVETISYIMTELNVLHPFREGNGRTIREFVREYANSKSKDLSIGEFEFNWSNVNIELLEESIRYARAFRSCFEIEFDKALTPVNNMKL